MSDPLALLVEEALMVGCECRLLGHTALDAGEDRVETVVYECGPRAGSKHQVVQTRWSVYVNGQVASSAIVGFRNAE